METFMLYWGLVDAVLKRLITAIKAMFYNYYTHDHDTMEGY